MVCRVQPPGAGAVPPGTDVWPPTGAPVGPVPLEFWVVPPVSGLGPPCRVEPLGVAVPDRGVGPAGGAVPIDVVVTACTGAPG